MKEIDEQIEYWSKLIEKQIPYNTQMSIMDIITPYCNLTNLLQYKIQILINKENDK